MGLGAQSCLIETGTGGSYVQITPGRTAEGNTGHLSDRHPEKQL